jgi:hypothetical protein
MMMMDGASAAEYIGEKVMEMCDRVNVADKAAPGCEATYAFEMDGIVYRVVVSVGKRNA